MAGKTPDITPAQIAAVVGSVTGIAAAYGLPVPPEASDSIVQTVQIVAPTLIGADFGLRWNRARVFGDKILDRQEHRERLSLRLEFGQVAFGALSFGVALAALVLTLT
jgi:hypothetical protein